MNKILAIETSSSACSIALQLENEIFSAHEIVHLQQAQVILPMIESLLQTHKIKLKQLDAIAFGCGPGSFTGVRIATSVAQGLSYAQALSVIPVSSLAALAQATYLDLGWKKIWVAIDARIQEVYCGAYEINAHGLAELIGKEQVCKPHDIVFPQDENSYGAGNAWEIYPLPFKPLQIDSTRLPMAVGVLQLANAKYARGEMIKSQDALPTYLRNDVAKKPSR